MRLDSLPTPLSWPFPLNGRESTSLAAIFRKTLMKTPLSLIALLLVSLTNVVQADDWQPDAGFKSLFNGKDLTGWSFRAKADRNSPKVGDVTEKFDGKTESSDAGRYSAKDGILTVNFPKGQERLISSLYTVEEFPKDFTLKLEFRASVNADSGIFIRKPQLQCRDYLVAGPYKELKKYKPQDWNQIEVVVKGGVARCTCNGEVLEAEFKLPETGPIGLEGDRGQMEYRRIQIK
jgi:Domain of Unknown Function (DUF1080)